MRILIQKFGGTSVATKERRNKAVQHVLRAVSEGYRPVVVVSAMGRRGDPYATDTLIEMARNENRQISPRELDLLMSCGEVISATVTAQAISSQGVKAVALTGGQAGIITDATFGNAKILEIRTEQLMKLLEAGVIPVVAGFQGVTRDGEITTLGRGGSDTSAAALGVALRAEWVDIYTDVAGVMTADPRLEPRARILAQLSYQEVVEMAHLGTKVIHPRAVEIAAIGQVSMRIRSVESDEIGTIVCTGKPGRKVSITGDRVVTGIAHVDSLAHVEIRSDDEDFPHQFVSEVFRKVAEAGISVDLIHVSPQLLAFNVDESKKEAAAEVLARLQPAGQVVIEGGYAKVSAVGAGMRGVPGVMSRIISALYAADCPVFQTTDSHANISCLVRHTDLPRAVQALHEEFGLDALND